MKKEGGNPYLKAPPVIYARRRPPQNAVGMPSQSASDARRFSVSRGILMVLDRHLSFLC